MFFAISQMAEASLGSTQLLLPLEVCFPKTVSQHLTRESPVVSKFSSSNSRKATWTRLAIPFTNALCASGTAKLNFSVKRRAAASFCLLCAGQCVLQPHLGEQIPDMTQEIICTGAHLFHYSLPAGFLLTSSKYLFWWLQKGLDSAGTELVPWKGKHRIEEDLRIFGAMIVFLSSFFSSFT